MMVDPVVVQQTVLKTPCGVDGIATTFELNWLSFGSEQTQDSGPGKTMLSGPEVLPGPGG